MRKHQRRPARGGFTLLEVLLVLAILGVIAAMVVPQLLGRQKIAMIKATQSSIQGLESALKMYAIDHDGNYPQGTSEDVFLLLTNPQDAVGRPMHPYLEAMPRDAWQSLLHYEYPATSKDSVSDKPAIWSSGPNKQSDDGQDDDITNWGSASV